MCFLAPGEMNVSTYSLSHLSNLRLSRELAASAARDRTSTATLLAHMAEFDARRLYLPAGYPSMHAYCVHELHLSEDSAFKRIRAARTAREYPAVFTAIAEGRLHLTAVVLLGPHLTPETADELLAAATHKSKPGIEQLIAERFLRQEVSAGMLALSSAGPSTEQLVPEPVESIITKLVPEAVGASASRPLAVPVSQPRVPLQLMVIPGTRDKLRYIGALMSHQVPSGDVAEVFDRLLDMGIRLLEKRKFGATAKPRPSRRRASHGGRYVPAAIKRAVWERDQGQCTFVSGSGRRCASRVLLEFDHIDPVARGGQASVAGIRLRCRAHNQYEAERVFGAEFMRHKREQARLAAAEARANAAARAAAEAKAAAEARTKAAAAEQAKERDVVPWLRQLGFRAGEARDAARLCESIPDAPIEERVRVALSFFHSKARSHGVATTA